MSDVGFRVISVSGQNLRPPQCPESDILRVRLHSLFVVFFVAFSVEFLVKLAQDQLCDKRLPGGGRMRIARRTVRYLDKESGRADVPRSARCNPESGKGIGDLPWNAVVTETRIELSATKATT